ncbi:acetyl-CoA carboxylase biotin carboxyl carrier protein subunit [Gilliamella sp. wkB108]|uniref:acetyl-CoA carboxylase biotin carboxyl carrier protein subunit n=1 Tax=Gilliamella sp. wkB108 TaxID=3120256 RepID=UPI00080DB37E|nr:acetyl-CoA carboxylase biotin carboxyl carrier protein subunit [Gilliamella apicola]OCG24265.1 acetyl-CoA carboxylase biotin carboxyl carrier protein subunit [Gilliamella apicola]
MTELKAKMPGKIVEYKVKVGDSVKKNQEVAIMEAMKMKNPLPAPADGIVKEIKAEVGVRLSSGDIILIVE